MVLNRVFSFVFFNNNECIHWDCLDNTKIAETPSQFANDRSKEFKVFKVSKRYLTIKYHTQ